jgi:hypothetical protein
MTDEKDLKDGVLYECWLKENELFFNELKSNIPYEEFEKFLFVGTHYAPLENILSELNRYRSEDIFATTSTEEITKYLEIIYPEYLI